MTNIARFTIAGTPSSDRRYDVAPGGTPVLQLEQSSSLVWRVTFEVRSAQTDSPRATRNAPTLTLNNGAGSTGQSVDATTPAASVTISSGIPSERAAHLWEIRCKVNGGTNPDGTPNPDWVFSRYMAMRSVQGLRKLLGSERDEYDTIDSWAGAINELIDLWSTSGGSVDPTKLPLSGLVPMQGNLQMGGSRITDVGTPILGSDAATANWVLDQIDSATGTLVDTTDSRLSDARTPTAHASTHLTGGGDAIAVATSSTDGLMPATAFAKLAAISAGAAGLTSAAPVAVTRAAAEVGDATTAARANHKHDIATATAVALTVGGSSSEGDSTSLARANHTHGLPAFGTSSGTFAQGNDARFGQVNGATVPAGTGLTTGHVLQVTGATALGYGFITNTNIGASAAIAVAKIAFGGTNQFLVGGLAANSWSAMTDTLHGNRGGGTLHALANSSAHGFVASTPATGTGILTSFNGAQSWATQIGSPYLVGNGTADRVLTTQANGVDTAFTLVTNAMLAGGIDWAKISHPTTFAPSAHATAHITGGSDVIPGAVAGGSAGLMSGLDKTKINQVPVLVTEQAGQIVYATSSRQFSLASPATLGLIDGSGTPGRLAKFGAAQTIADSVLSDDGTNVAIASAGSFLRQNSDGYFVQAGGTDGNYGLFYDQSGSSVQTWAANVCILVAHKGGRIEIPGQLQINGGSPAAGKLLQCDANGLGSWSEFANVGYSNWTPYVTAASADSSVTVATLTIPNDPTRAGDTWLGVYEFYVYCRTSSSTYALCVYRMLKSIAVSYDGSGNAAIVAVTSETTDADRLRWENHTGGVPTINGISLGAVSGNSVPVVLAKPTGGAVFSARERHRIASLMQTDAWY